MFLVAASFGLDGAEAAAADRFTTPALRVIRSRFAGGKFTTRASSDAQLAQAVVKELTAELGVREWMQTLLADINNQQADAERLVDRSCIFKWVSKNMPDHQEEDEEEEEEEERPVTMHDVFYSEERAREYADLDPRRPDDANRYEPFMSPRVLAAVLTLAGFLRVVVI